MCNNNNNKILRTENITVVLGTTATIITNVVPVEDYAIYILYIGTAFPTFVGTEAVSLSIGGTLYPLIDAFGNVVTLGKLRDGQFFDCGNVKTAKYRLGFGSNGLPTAIPHFVVFEGLCPMRYNGSAGSNDNTTEV